MILEELRHHAADLFPQASAHAIHRPGESNEAYKALERLCWDYYETLGFSCMADCFAAAAPAVEGCLALDAWCSLDVEMRGWIIEVRFRPLYSEQYAHAEIYHDSALPGVTETGYLSRFIPMTAFAEASPEEVLREILSGLPAVRQLNLF